MEILLTGVPCYIGISSLVTVSSMAAYISKHYVLLSQSQVMLSTRQETDEVVVKLGDFGLSTFLEDDQAPSTYAGTKEYLAPVSSATTMVIITDVLTLDVRRSIDTKRARFTGQKLVTYFLLAVSSA